MSKATQSTPAQAVQRLFHEEQTPQQCERMLAEISIIYFSHFTYITAPPEKQESMQIFFRDLRAFFIEVG